ncbi:MAG: ATPase domain-containing protein [bacterium]
MALSLAELVRLLPPPAPATPALPTGIALLDAALLGGGLPRGRLTEIVGSTGSGKTTLVRAIVEATVASSGWVAYIDAQRTLDARDWVHLGDAEGMWMIRPHDVARAAWSADILLRSGAFALVVLDGAPTLSKGAAVRLTRLAREANAAFVVMGDRAGGGTQLGGAVRLIVERRTPRARGREGEKARGREDERTRGREDERTRGREGDTHDRRAGREGRNASDGGGELCIRCGASPVCASRGSRSARCGARSSRGTPARPPRARSCSSRSRRRRPHRHRTSRQRTGMIARSC